MTQDSFTDQSKEKFRPEADPELDKQIEAALEGVQVDQLVGEDKTSEGRTRIKGPVTGAIYHVDLVKGEVLVVLDGKNQGVVSLQQYEDQPAPAIGLTEEFVVDKYDDRDGIYKLNRKGHVSNSTDWDSLATGQRVEGEVTGMNKGGLELQLSGSIRGFMPAGQVDIQFHKDISIFIGQRLQAVVTKVDRKGKNLILSRRAILEVERKEAKEKLMLEIAEGQTRRGTISSVMEYGAFVDLGGADGLIHVSELTHRRGVKPSDVVRVGDMVDVKIVKIDKETGKLSLSLKQLMSDPWQGAEMKFGVGSPVTGRVTKIESFGAFVELEEGLEGLLPVSEISWQRVKSVGDVLKVNDIIKLQVISLDTTNRKVSLSLKQAGPDPWKESANKYHKNDVVNVKITRVVDFGAFAELEPGLEGLIHISELANHRIRSAGEVVKPGQETQVRITEVDPEKKRISLSVKQVTAPAPETIAPEPTTPAKPKKPKNLRGGLDWDWMKK